MSDSSPFDQIPDPLAPEAALAHGGAAPRVPLAASPDRVAIQRRRRVAFGASLAWLAGHLGVYGIRQDFTELPIAYMLAQIVLPVVVGACSLVVALAPGKLGLGVGISLVSAMALVGPASFCVLASSLPAPHPALNGQLGFWLSSLSCLGIAISCAALPLLMAALSLRRAFSTQAAWRSALVGAGLGAFSGATINLHCANVDAWHLVTGHGVPVVVAAGLGAFLVARWTRA